MFKKNYKWVVVPVIILVIFFAALYVWNKNRPKSMWATNCNHITIENNGQKVTLNWIQQHKVIKFCEKIEDFDGTISDQYDVIIDFHNEIVTLYINSEEKKALAKVCVDESNSTAYNYCKISDEFNDYIHNILNQ